VRGGLNSLASQPTASVFIGSRRRKKRWRWQLAKQPNWKRSQKTEVVKVSEKTASGLIVIQIQATEIQIPADVLKLAENPKYWRQ
jgi:hypothetical protein